MPGSCPLRSRIGALSLLANFVWEGLGVGDVRCTRRALRALGFLGEGLAGCWLAGDTAGLLGSARAGFGAGGGRSFAGGGGLSRVLKMGAEWEGRGGVSRDDRRNSKREPRAVAEARLHHAKRLELRVAKIWRARPRGSEATGGGSFAPRRAGRGSKISLAREGMVGIRARSGLGGLRCEMKVLDARCTQ